VGKLHQKLMKCSEQLLVAMPREEHGLLSGFLDSNVGKLQLKIVSVIRLSTVAQTKTWRTLAISSLKTDEVPFHRVILKGLVLIMLAIGPKVCMFKPG
jgi:hypothetical protein